MKIKIVKCSKETYWYNDKVGLILEYENVVISEKRIMIKPEQRGILFIEKSDCEIIEEVKPESIDQKKIVQISGCGDNGLYALCSDGSLYFGVHSTNSVVGWHKLNRPENK
jgi:hypothetical protein